MSNLSNAGLAQRVNDLVSRWDVREKQYSDWLAGTAIGGPYGDGRYPLTSSSGSIYYIKCPAALQAEVDGPASTVGSQAAASAASATAANASATAAVTSANQATNQRNQAVDAKAGAELARQIAEASQAAAESARVSAEAAAVSAAADAADLTQAVLDVDADRVAAEAAQVSAAASAAAAATFDPTNFHTKTAADARFRMQSAALAISDTTGLQTALDAKAPLASPTFTGTVAGITKAMVGLGSVDNTSDAGKPVSTAQAAAIALKAPLASPQFTGIPVSTGGEMQVGASAGTYVKFRYDGAMSYNGGTYNALWHAGNFTPASKLDNRAELAGAARIVTDWNSAVNNGWYMAAGAANAPAAVGGSWLIGTVTQHNSLWIQQEVWQFTAGPEVTRYRRHMLNGGWSAWTVSMNFGQAQIGEWPANPAYVGLHNTNGGYSIMSGKVGLDNDTYISSPHAGGYVVLRAGMNNWNAELRVGPTQVTTNIPLQIYGGPKLTQEAGALRIEGHTRMYYPPTVLWANSGGWTVQPRIFVQSVDPGAACVDGDLWIW